MPLKQASIIDVEMHSKRNTVPPLTSLTSWSSRRPQAPLVGALRASHCGAAYRER